MKISTVLLQSYDQNFKIDMMIMAMTIVIDTVLLRNYRILGNRKQRRYTELKNLRKVEF